MTPRRYFRAVEAATFAMSVCLFSEPGPGPGIPLQLSACYPVSWNNHSENPVYKSS